MKYFTILYLFLTAHAMANGPVPSEYSQIILGSLWEEAGHPPFKYQEPTPPKKIVDNKVMPKPVPKPTPIPGPAPAPAPAPAPKKLSKGETYVQEMLKKNRERLKELERAKKEQQSSQNRQDKSDVFQRDAQSSKGKSLQEQYLDGLTKMKRQTQRTYTNWRNLQQETYDRWRKKQKEFLENLPHYKKALFKFEAGVELPLRKLRKPLGVADPSKYHLIPGAFDIPARNQGRRPTCASFSAIRAVETVLKSEGVDADLSEQYFYWASKPSCQQSPCSERGSWAREALERSQNSPFADIPSESDCPYTPKQRPGNETQIPLRSNCQRGLAKVTGFQTLGTLDEIYRAIQQDHPVIAGFTLSPNFYKTKGIVTLGGSSSSGRMDSHAAGHALVLVGTMLLPKKMWAREGRICFITSNSWGEGWGRGGHGCLTENWVKKHRIKNAFLSVSGAKIY